MSKTSRSSFDGDWWFHLFLLLWVLPHQSITQTHYLNNTHTHIKKERYKMCICNERRCEHSVVLIWLYLPYFCKSTWPQWSTISTCFSWWAKISPMWFVIYLLCETKERSHSFTPFTECSITRRILWSESAWESNMNLV